MVTPLPVDEATRVRTLRALSILDTPRERRFDRFATLAANLFDVPVAAVSFIDADRQWFKSAIGLEVSEVPRQSAICSRTILQPGPTVISDIRAHPEFADHPYGKGPLQVRFYAGHPVRAEDGSSVGTLAIMDRRPREFSEREREMLADLADLVSQEVYSLGVAALDRVTGLPSRRGFTSVAEQVIAISRRHNHSVSLLLIEMNVDGGARRERLLDDGDERLAETAELLRFAFRQSDVIGHLGSGRFCVLLTGTDVDQAAICLDRLSSELRARNAIAGPRQRLSYRLGAAEYRDTAHCSLEDLIQEAASSADAREIVGRTALA
jgi:diguanylate cyclase (GGDEF)-like protein